MLKDRTENRLLKMAANVRNICDNKTLAETGYYDMYDVYRCYDLASNAHPNEPFRPDGVITEADFSLYERLRRESNAQRRADGISMRWISPL